MWETKPRSNTATVDSLELAQLDRIVSSEVGEQKVEEYTQSLVNELSQLSDAVEESLRDNDTEIRQLVVANRVRINKNSYQATLDKAQQFDDEGQRIISEILYLEEQVPLQAKLVYALRDKRASNASFADRRDAYSLNVALILQNIQS